MKWKNMQNWASPSEGTVFNLSGQSKIVSTSQNHGDPKLLRFKRYPIPAQLQQEYTDMPMLSKRLNGSASKIKIGTHQLEYDLDNDGNFREGCALHQ